MQYLADQVAKLNVVGSIPITRSNFFKDLGSIWGPIQIAPI